MLDQSLARINLAVDDCLNRCTQSTDSRQELRRYVQEAEQRGDLSENELRTVENIVLRILLDRQQRSS